MDIGTLASLIVSHHSLRSSETYPRSLPILKHTFSANYRSKPLADYSRAFAYTIMCDFVRVTNYNNVNVESLVGFLRRTFVQSTSNLILVF